MAFGTVCAGPWPGRCSISQGDREVMGIGRTVLLLLLTLFAAPALPMPGDPPDARNAALADFDFMVDYLQRNYAGWEHKVASSPERRTEFEALARQQRAIIAEDPAKAGTAMHDLLTWFKDRHTGLESLQGQPPVPAATTAKTNRPQAASNIKAERIDAAALRKQLAGKDGRNPLRGAVGKR